MPPKRDRLGDYLDEWIAGCKARVAAGELGAGTLRQYEDTLRLYVRPALGNLRVADLTPALLQEWVDSLLTRGLSPRTVGLARTTVRTAIQRGVKLRAIPANPVDATDGPRRAKEKRAKVLTLAQMEALLAEAYRTGHGKSGNGRGTHYAPLMEFLWLSGLRPSEALGLRWGAVDLEAGCVHVERSRVKIGGGMVDKEQLKTEASRRRVDLPARGVECLRRLREAAPSADGLVFVTAKGTGMTLDGLDRAFRRLRDRLGLPRVRPYDLRHTAATMQLSAGVPLPVLSKRLGHSDISTTANIYLHLTEEDNRAAAESVDAYLGKRGTKAGPSDR